MNTHQPAVLSKPQKQALQWLARLRGSQCSDQDKQAFSDWLALAPEHATAYTEVQQFWEQISDLPDMAGTRLGAARSYIRNAQTSRRRRTTFLVIGAIVVGFMTSQPEYFLQLTAKHYQTAKGEHISIQLADGSGIEVNTDSELKVAELFGYRKVWLEHGEAWFSVHHNPEQPFEVLVGKGRIRDIGTQFNVLTDAARTAVAVEEGEVSISMPDREPVSVTAGRQSGFDETGLINAVTAVDFKAVSAWRSGMLIFKQQSLPEVLRQLSRYHKVDFELPDAKLQNVTVSGRFSTTDLNESLNTLANGLGVKITRLTPERISIRAAK